MAMGMLVVADLELVDESDDRRDEVAEADTDGHGQEDPQGQEAVEELESLDFRGSSGAPFASLRIRPHPITISGLDDELALDRIGHETVLAGRIEGPLRPALHCRGFFASGAEDDPGLQDDPNEDLGPVELDELRSSALHSNEARSSLYLSTPQMNISMTQVLTAPTKASSGVRTPASPWDEGGAEKSISGPLPSCRCPLCPPVQVTGRLVDLGSAIIIPAASF